MDWNHQVFTRAVEGGWTHRKAIRQTWGSKIGGAQVSEEEHADFPRAGIYGLLQGFCTFFITCMTCIATCSSLTNHGPNTAPSALLVDPCKWPQRCFRLDSLGMYSLPWFLLRWYGLSRMLHHPRDPSGANHCLVKLHASSPSYISKVWHTLCLDIIRGKTKQRARAEAEK